MLMLSATLELGFFMLLCRYSKNNFIKTWNENDGNAKRVSSGVQFRYSETPGHFIIQAGERNGRFN